MKVIFLLLVLIAIASASFEESFSASVDSGDGQIEDRLLKKSTKKCKANCGDDISTCQNKDKDCKSKRKAKRDNCKAKCKNKSFRCKWKCYCKKKKGVDCKKVCTAKVKKCADRKRGRGKKETSVRVLKCHKDNKKYTNDCFRDCCAGKDVSTPAPTLAPTPAPTSPPTVIIDSVSSGSVSSEPVSV